MLSGPQVYFSLSLHTCLDISSFIPDADNKGGSTRTYAIDRDAAQHFISASVHTPSITKFLMVSYNGSRRNQPPWWSDDQWASAQKVNSETLKDYYAAKLDADECLTALAKQRGDGFAAIVLRAGVFDRQ